MESLSSGSREQALRTAWEINVSPALVDDESAYARFLAIAAERAVAIPVIMAQVQAIAVHDTSARLPGLRVPALIVHGTEDQLLPVANAHLMASLIPGARLEILEGVGHLFFWERPQRSAELVRAHAAVPA